MTSFDLLALVGVTIGLVFSTLLAPLHTRFPMTTCALCVGFWVGALGAWAISGHDFLEAWHVVWRTAFAVSVLSFVTARVLYWLDTP